MYNGVKAILSQSRLKELMSYDPDSGVFTRLIDCNRSKKGEAVSCKHNKGYFRVSIDGTRYLLHRLAFLFMEGRMPDEIDHINGDRSDNRWANLRECCSRQNKFNMTSRSKSGVKGVYWNKEKEKWQAQLSIDGKVKFLGRFKNLDDARDVVIEARNVHHGEFARHE